MKKVIKEIYPYLIILIVVIFIKSLIIAPVQVNGDSMDNTLKDGDIMLLNKIGYKLNGVERFDIVVINYENNYLIKRVIGLPGDNIKFIDNKLYPELNNKLEELSKKYNVKKNAIAISWILTHPANIIPIVGTTSITHLLEMIEGINIKLTRKEWYELYLANGHKLP